MTLPDYAIQATGLVKTYPASKTSPAKTALRGIDLVVPRGSMFGLLGPNGAGKSTFINILAGLVNKTEGEVTVWGTNIDVPPPHRPRRHRRGAPGTGGGRLLHPPREPGSAGGDVRRAQERASHHGNPQRPGPRR